MIRCYIRDYNGTGDYYRDVTINPNNYSYIEMTENEDAFFICFNGNKHNLIVPFSSEEERDRRYDSVMSIEFADWRGSQRLGQAPESTESIRGQLRAMIEKEKKLSQRITELVESNEEMRVKLQKIEEARNGVSIADINGDLEVIDGN